MRSLSPVLFYSRRTYTDRYTSHAAVRSRHWPGVRAIVLDAFIVLGSPLSTTYIHGSLYVHVPSIKRPTLLCARSILSVLLYLMAIVSTVPYVGRNTFTHHTLSISERVPLCWLSIVASSSVLAKHACILQLVCYDGSLCRKLFGCANDQEKDLEPQQYKSVSLILRPRAYLRCHGNSGYKQQKSSVYEKSTAPGIPRRSPIQVLTGLDVA